MENIKLIIIMPIICLLVAIIISKDNAFQMWMVIQLLPSTAL
jgi:hypothetical protein